MTTCKKRYMDIPFAHRQPRHDGHCAQIHGHNWDFEFTFATNQLDENGFVVDFGKLKFIKTFLDKFDHALVVPQYDCEMDTWNDLSNRGLVNLVVVPDASAEGLTNYLLSTIGSIVSTETKGRVWVDTVTVYEDQHNSASTSIDYISGEKSSKIDNFLPFQVEVV